ncbi:MAG: restriction endonuclease subunit S [Cetobacterium sp.]
MVDIFNTISWKEFKMIDIFNFYKGKRLTKENMLPGKVPFISAISENNGVRQYIDIKPLFNGKYITVNYNGSVGEAFYQNGEFYASDDVNILELKDRELTKGIAMFLITIIKKEKIRFGFGRKWKLEAMKETIIKLPIDSLENPDWEYMEIYIKKLWETKIPNLNEFKKAKAKKKMKLKSPDSWKEFKIKDIFEVKGTKTTSIETLNIYGKGCYPYITTKSVNNGVSGYFNFFTEEKNVLTIDSAVLGYCSYQKENFSASDHVEKLILKDRELNSSLALFLVTLINLERPRYSYGRKFSQNRIKESIIKLPINSLGNPDWEYMENYIKSLPYSNKI